ncbi:MORC family CW-type zinc finger protein 3 [Pelobates fuscus]|uniref:MORC family CW-type zinc finger protein 3 n=1 Tax=Pelobates fuscus TaxID=191477 RepID=UPI002FE461D3
MAAQTTNGIRLSALCPKFLHTNSTSHTWPFSAVAELIDNAYDPDVNAKQLWIDKTTMKGHMCLTFTDNGNGMNLDKLHKMLSFGFSDKVAVHGHVPVGLYGNGFKSGSMRLGKDAIVFTKNDSGMHVGMLSQTFLEKIGAEHVMVPIISFNKHRQLANTADSDANLEAILKHSLLSSERELLAELDAIIGKKGTRIIIWRLRREKRGSPEFDFESDKYDIRIPEEIDGTLKRGYKKQERVDQIAPDSDYSLRAYCSILYLKPRMQIILRQQKVQTQLVSKSLAHIEKDVYRPKFLAPKTVKITFGYNCRNKEHYGIMMYHKNRLIKAYVKVGCQLKANNMGVGVVGVIECNFLKPTHNKQDFDYTNDYRLTLTALGEKLNDYWNEMKVKKNINPQSVPVEDTQKKPDQNWVQCDSCLKWRKLPDAMGRLPMKWYCYMNPDPQFRDCNVPEEPEDDDEITHSTYEKTYKRRKSEQNQQAYEKTTILFTPPNKDIQPAVSSMQRMYNNATLPVRTLGMSPENRSPGISLEKFSANDRNKRSLSSERSPITVKKPRTSETDTIELTDLDEIDDGDVIILEENSTPKPKNENGKSKSESNLSPITMDILDANSPDRANSSDTIAVATQTERVSLTIKKEEENSNNPDCQENEGLNYCNGTESHDDPEQQPDKEQSVNKSVNTLNHETEHYKRQCKSLEWAVKDLQSQLVDTKNKYLKTEVSHQFTQTDACSTYTPENSSKQLVAQYEQALKEISRLKIQCNTLQQLKAEPDANIENKVKDTSEVDDMAEQLDGVFRQLDECCTERDGYKSQVEKLKQENTRLHSQNSQLETEVEQMKVLIQEMNSKETATTSTAGESEESLKLRTLRVNVAQLLTTLMPDLDIQQINYDVDVIDDILTQVLEQTEKQASGNE